MKTVYRRPSAVRCERGTDLGDLPALDGQADAAADLDDGVGVVVQHIEHDHHRLEHAEEDGANREALQRLAVVPELNVCSGGIDGSSGNEADRLTRRVVRQST